MPTLSTTWVQQPQPITTGRYACLVHIYPSGESLGRRYSLGDHPVVIGRSDDNDIAIHDHAVSRKHVRLDPTPDGVFVSDLVSTNGTFINDLPVKGTAVIRDGDYLRVGNNIYRFLTGGNVEAEYQEEIYRLTIVDGLTQIHNRRFLVDFLDRELARSARHSCPLAFLLFDVDRFKTINESIGPLAGNFALRELAATVRGLVRREDLFARYGGDEFGIVLVETPPAEARKFARHVCDAVAKRIFHFEEHLLRLTVSAGVACVGGNGTLSSKDLIQIADRRLSEAKHAGRNRVVGPDVRARSPAAHRPAPGRMHGLAGLELSGLRAV
jgi:diguanylate cyclase (GGDEF)-like protein